MYLFTYRKVVRNKVKLQGEFDKKTLIGLCLKNNIRFYNWDLCGFVNSKEFFESGGTRDLKRMFNAWMDHFTLDENNYLTVRENRSSDVTKNYCFKNGVYIMYTDKCFDLIEPEGLTEYLKDHCFDPSDEPKILLKDPIVLSRTTEDRSKMNFEFRKLR